MKRNHATGVVVEIRLAPLSPDLLEDRTGGSACG